MVMGLVPADYLTPISGKRQIKSRQFKDGDTSNIIDNLPITAGVLRLCSVNLSELFKNSFFPKPTFDWNHLEESVVRAETVNGFRKGLGLKKSFPALSHCVYA